MFSFFKKKPPADLPPTPQPQADPTPLPQATPAPAEGGGSWWKTAVGKLRAMVSAAVLLRQEFGSD